VCGAPVVICNFICSITSIIKSADLEEELSDGEEVSGEEQADSEEDINVEEFLAEGKKCLAAGDAAAALECLQEVCSTL